MANITKCTVTALRDLDYPLGLHDLLGERAWRRLPAAVRARFSEPIRRVDYIGEFDVVRASLLGRAIAWFCTLIGTPVVPRTGQGITAIIHVGPVDRGASWLREYQWPNGRVCRVHSTKVIGADGTLVEELPAGLRMPLEVFERHGVLHFVSLGYYFQLGRALNLKRVRLFSATRFMQRAAADPAIRDSCVGALGFYETRDTHPNLRSYGVRAAAKPLQHL
jgi:Domain of unknown function (DUF4166)